MADPGAPGELDKVLAFVNTRDIEERTDELTSPAALAAWLVRNDLAGTAHLTDADLDRALALREALRDTLRSHASGGAHDSGARDAGAHDSGAYDGSAYDSGVLGRLAAGLPTRLGITETGDVTVTADGDDGPAALARLLLIAARAVTLGTWARLKVCSADNCRWAFYDRSPTRSGCWCSMRICGSRAKSRAYRRRAVTAGPTATASRSARTAAPGA